MIFIKYSIGIQLLKFEKAHLKNDYWFNDYCIIPIQLINIMLAVLYAFMCSVCALNKQINKYNCTKYSTQ